MRDFNIETTVGKILNFFLGGRGGILVEIHLLSQIKNDLD